MSEIWKFRLNSARHTVLQMPAGAKPIKAAFVSDVLYVWAIVQPKNPTVHKRFHVIATGEGFEDEHTLDHIDTVFIDWLVFHVFVERLI